MASEVYLDTLPGEYGTDDYYQSPAFVEYARKIETIILSLDGGGTRPVTLAEIHRELGPDIRREWTLDAISTLDSVEEAFSYRLAWHRKPFRLRLELARFATCSAIVNREEIESHDERIDS
jgi:hypothetical protein